MSGTGEITLRFAAEGKLELTSSRFTHPALCSESGQRVENAWEARRADFRWCDATQALALLLVKAALAADEGDENPVEMSGLKHSPAHALWESLRKPDGLTGAKPAIRWPTAIFGYTKDRRAFIEALVKVRKGRGLYLVTMEQGLLPAKNIQIWLDKDNVTGTDKALRELVEGLTEPGGGPVTITRGFALDEPSVALPAATGHPPAHDYQSRERVARGCLEAGIDCLRLHEDLRTPRKMMENGLKILYGFSLSDPELRPQGGIPDLISASRHFRCFGDLLRTQREIELAFKVYEIARQLVTSVRSSPEADCELGKLQSSIGESHLRLRKPYDTNDRLQNARTSLQKSIQLHEKHPPCWFERFQSLRILADILLALGEPYPAKVHLDRAEECWQLSEAESDPATRRLFGWLRRSRGDFHTATADWERADTEYRAALANFQTAGDLIGKAVIWRRLESLNRRQGKDVEAAEMRDKALRIIESIPGMENVREQFEQDDTPQPDRCGILSLP